MKPLTALALACLAGAPFLIGAGAAPPATVPGNTGDARPVVRLMVKNSFKPEDKIFPQVVEGRLISDLADMETFKTTGEGGDYLLLATIRNVTLETGITYENSRDADASDQPKSKEMVTVTMDMALSLQSLKDASARELYTGKLSVSASRELEVSLERTNELLTQELIDRAAQKLERTLRKNLPKRRS